MLLQWFSFAGDISLWYEHLSWEIIKDNINTDVRQCTKLCTDIRMVIIVKKQFINFDCFMN